MENYNMQKGVNKELFYENTNLFIKTLIILLTLFFLPVNNFLIPF